MAKKIKKTELEWKDVMHQCAMLAYKIENSGTNFDHVISIGRGGFIPARVVAEILKIRRVHNLGIDFYDENNEKKDVANVYQKPDFKCNPEDTILLIDDIYDSGETIKKAHEILNEMGAYWIFTAVLTSKVKNLDNTYFVGENVNPKKWVVFPWEAK